MELSTKPDFGQCMDRVEAWWDCQVIDRPPVTIHVRPERAARQVPPRRHASLRDRWLDYEYAIEKVAADAANGVFLAETFPRYVPNLGPEVCSTAYGAELKFSEHSSWSVPVADDIRQVLSMQPDLDSPYWRVIRQATDLSLQRGAGKWITAVTDMHTNGDLLASLRDPQNLCLDYADDLAGVQAACRHVTPHMKVFFDDLYAARIARTGQPCCTWGVAVSRRAMYYVSCDFICMISPAMFAATILPALEWEIAQLGRSIFHLDGPGALKHLDALLATRLNAVQWTFGAGAGPARRWIDVYRRIQSAGKGMEVQAADMNDARAVMEHVRPEGVWLAVAGSYSRQEAQAFLNETARWAAGKK